MKQRLKEITYLRAFAAISIILIHASSGHVGQGLIGFTTNQFARFGSPVFVIISGFLLYHIEKLRPAPSYFHFLKHRFSKLAVPYVIWTLVYSFYRINDIAGSNGNLTPIIFLKKYLFNVITGQGYVHLYFVLIMLQLYALFPLLKKGLEWRPKLLLLITFLTSFGFQMLIYMHQIKIIVLPSITIAYVTLFPAWIFFFYLGMYLKTTYSTWTVHWRKHAILYTGAWALFFVVTLWDSWVHQIFYSVKPSSTFYGVSSFFLFYMLWDYLKDKVPERVDRFLEWTANNSFKLYLAHPLFLNILARNMRWDGTLKMFALFFIAVAATMLFIYISEVFKEFIEAYKYLGRETGKRTADSIKGGS